MKILTPILIGSLVMGCATLGSNVTEKATDKPIAIRVATYNVEYGENASPEEIGKMFKPYKLSIIGFNEVPDGDWTARVGKVLGMKHSYVGKISSANHKDKYKSILSRTPFEATAEYELSVERKLSLIHI